jgi:hypothetical protein
MPANQAQIEQIISLMEATDTDWMDVLLEVFSNWDDEAVLALLPPSRLHAALVYLQQAQAEQQAQEAGHEEPDLS